MSVIQGGPQYEEDALIEDAIKELASGPNFGTVTTLGRDGGPATHVMWVDCDDEYMLLNTETHRIKYKNVTRDPRVSIVVWDRDDPYNYVEVRGRVVERVSGTEALRHIHSLSHKYDNKPYPENKIKSERVILKVAPERQRA